MFTVMSGEGVDAINPSLIASMKELLNDQLGPLVARQAEFESSLSSQAKIWSTDLETKVRAVVDSAVGASAIPAGQAGVTVMDPECWTMWESYHTLVSTPAEARLLLDHALGWAKTMGVDPRGLRAIENAFAIISPIILSVGRSSPEAKASYKAFVIAATHEGNASKHSSDFAEHASTHSRLHGTSWSDWQKEALKSYDKRKKN